MTDKLDGISMDIEQAERSKLQSLLYFSGLLG